MPYYDIVVKTKYSSKSNAFLNSLFPTCLSRSSDQGSGKRQQTVNQNTVDHSAIEVDLEASVPAQPSVEIPTGTCEKVTSDLGSAGGFRRVIRFLPTHTTVYSLFSKDKVETWQKSKRCHKYYHLRLQLVNIKNAQLIIDVVSGLIFKNPFSYILISLDSSLSDVTLLYVYMLYLYYILFVVSMHFCDKTWQSLYIDSLLT